MDFLTSLGIFEVPPPDEGEVTLTAEHLSFIEFFAAVGTLLSADIKSELQQIGKRERFEAVSTYMRYFFVLIFCVVNTKSVDGVLKFKK